MNDLGNAVDCTLMGNVISCQLSLLRYLGILYGTKGRRSSYTLNIIMKAIFWTLSTDNKRKTFQGVALYDEAIRRLR